MINEKSKQVLCLPIKNNRFQVQEKEAFDFSLGNILGDAYIHLSKGQMCFDHSLEEYSEWKKKKAISFKLTSSTAQLSRTKRKRLDKTTLKIINTQSYRFYSRSLFRIWRSFFYTLKVPGNPTYGQGQSICRKKVPHEILDWLISPFSLAIFYMDDSGVQIIDQVPCMKYKLEF